MNAFVLLSSTMSSVWSSSSICSLPCYSLFIAPWSIGACSERKSFGWYSIQCISLIITWNHQEILFNIRNIKMIHTFTKPINIKTYIMKNIQMDDSHVPLIISIFPTMSLVVVIFILIILKPLHQQHGQ